jgi:Tat protein secretion system quality control protein TatD with DNase activity
VYQKISEIKKISLRELQEIIEENFKNTFLKWSIG